MKPVEISIDEEMRLTVSLDLKAFEIEKPPMIGIHECEELPESADPALPAPTRRFCVDLFEQR